MKPTLVEEEDDDVPDSGSMKSISQVQSCPSQSIRSRTQRSQQSDGAGSRAACDAIQGVAPATEMEGMEVEVQVDSEDDEVLKEKSMHLPMRCNYWEAADRNPTLAPKKTQASHATQSSWGSEDVGEEKRVVTFAEPTHQGKAATTAPALPTQKNQTQHTHSSYASLPQAQSVGLSAEGNEFEIWDETWGVAAAASKSSKGKHPTESEHCSLDLKSEKPKSSCWRIRSLCAQHRWKFCCCGAFFGSLAFQRCSWEVKVRNIQSELEADRAALVFKAFASAKFESSLGMANLEVVCDIDVSLSFLMMKETQDRAEMSVPMLQLAAQHGVDGWWEKDFASYLNVSWATPVALHLPDNRTLVIRDHHYPLDDLYCYVNGWYNLPNRAEVLTNFSYLEELSDTWCDHLAKIVPGYYNLSMADLKAESLSDEAVLENLMNSGTGAGYVPQSVIDGMYLHAAAKCVMRGRGNRGAVCDLALCAGRGCFATPTSSELLYTQRGECEKVTK
eukprot:Skav229010  [mRNA]  locus=scaffold127:423241:430190:- [translate_table: standard]